MPFIATSNTYFQTVSKSLHALVIKTNKKIPRQYPRLFNDYSSMVDKRPFLSILPWIGLGTFALKPEGQTPALDNFQEGTMSTYNFLVYALGYVYTEEAQDDDAKAMLPRLAKMLPYSQQVTEELLVWAIINLGFTSGINLFDGVSLFNTAHVLSGLNTTVSNSGGTTALSPEALNIGMYTMAATQDDQGLPISRTARWLVVPKELYKQAEEITGAPMAPYTDQNTPNVLYEKLTPIVSRFITSTTFWGLFADKGDIEGDTHSMFYAYKYRQRQRFWQDDSTGNFNQKMQMRLTWGTVDFRGAYASQGS